MLVEPGTHAGHEPPDVDDPPLEKGHHLGHRLLERQFGVDAADPPLDRTHVEGVIDDRLDQCVLAGEHPEDGAFRDPGRVGDVVGGHHLPVLEEQGQGRGDDHRAAFVGRQRGGPPRTNCLLARDRSGTHDRRGYLSEYSLSNRILTTGLDGGHKNSGMLVPEHRDGGVARKGTGQLTMRAPGSGTEWARRVAPAPERRPRRPWCEPAR